MIGNVRAPSIGDISAFGASPTVLKSAKLLIQDSEVSEFQIVQKSDSLDISCKVHAKIRSRLIYPVSFSYSATGIGSKRCECESNEPYVLLCVFHLALYSLAI